MIVAGLDIESTGLDKVKDRPIELGLSLYTTNFNRGLEANAFLVQSDGVPVTDEITEITGITQAMCDKYGRAPKEAYEESLYFVEQSAAIVAFNGRRFDIPMMHAWAKRVGLTFPDKLIIDPYEDMPATLSGSTPGMRPQELITMCAKEGIYYDPHEAGADVGAMLRLMAKRKFEHVLERAQSPMMVIQSHQAYGENAKAKKQKFRWNPERKIWWKSVKKIDLDGLWKAINNEFSISETDYTVEQLDTSE
jgi:DNA polymerase III alpha subunit (gram-positive type)